MVRARKRDSRTDKMIVTSRITARVNRSARTTRRMSRALTVSSSTPSPRTAIAALMNGVPSGARRISVTGRPDASAARASGQAASESTTGGVNIGRWRAPTIASKPLSSARATPRYQASSAGSRIS
jgi:hypothetical protein